MENKDLDNFFKERAPQFNEQPGDALWAKIETGLDTPAPKQGGRGGAATGKWVWILSGLALTIVAAVFIYINYFALENEGWVTFPKTEIQQGENKAASTEKELQEEPVDTVKPKVLAPNRIKTPKRKKKTAIVNNQVAGSNIDTTEIDGLMDDTTPIANPAPAPAPQPKKVKISVQESAKRTVITLREKVSQEKFDSIVTASLVQYKDKAGMQLIVKGFNGMIYRSNIPQKGEVQTPRDTIKTQTKNKLAVTARLITTTNGIATESAEFTPKYDSVTDTYFVQYGKPGAPQQDPVYTAQLTVQPEFPGGNTEFLRLVTSKFRVPEAAKPATVRVQVSFIIETNGSISNIKVLKDPGYGLGAEAVRVLKSLTTKWKPGEVKGEAVRTAHFFPITVSIK
jgi:Gram-negative bacterial TonB protein C-terminal